MTLVGDLTRAEWRARKRTYLVLLLLLASTSATYFLVLSLVGGLENRLGSELSDTLVADVRLAEGRTGVGDGRVMTDAADRMSGLSYYAPGSRFTARLEVETLFLHGADFTTDLENPGVTRASGLLVGVDPVEGEQVAPLEPYLVQGVGLRDAPRDYRTPRGEALVPLLVGEGFMRATNATVATGEFDWSAVYNITAGRFENGQPLKIRGIIVGVYATGFNMMDRFVVYAPRTEVGRLLGYHPQTPPANIILGATSDPERVAEAAARYNLTAQTPDSFRREYLGPAFDAVDAFAWALVGILTLMTSGWIAHTLGHHVNADSRKIATLRAIGIPEGTFARVYLLVGGGLGLAGGLLGVAAGLALGALTGWVTAMPGVLPGNTPLVPNTGLIEMAALVLLAVATAAGAAGLALARLRRFTIRDALHAP